MSIRWEYFEKNEQNPMVGLRGASRYINSHYREAFMLECHGIKKVREKMGSENVIVMIPFRRTPEEVNELQTLMAKYELQRGQQQLKVYMMCELLSNIILAEQFASQFDVFIIDCNDLTQLILGLDKD
jgi:pyruvate,water dikinase